ncbi:MAG TPA: hypothetical protein VEW45_02235 [Candidatus Dormibacteraeota bacterium]|nr:hypothetical protein [Candidatus Dormibacteraeota bacterium]
MNESRTAGRPRAAAPFLLVATLALVVAACSSPAAATPSPTDTPASPSLAEPTPSSEPTATPGPRLYTKVKVGEEQYVTVTEVESWPGNDTQQPAAGTAFQSVSIRIDAITTTSFTSEDFTVRAPDGNIYPESPPGRSPHLSFQNGMTPNTYWEAFVTFEVPLVDADELFLLYSPDFVDAPVEIQLY